MLLHSTRSEECCCTCVLTMCMCVCVCDVDKMLENRIHHNGATSTTANDSRHSFSSHARFSFANLILTTRTIRPYRIEFSGAIVKHSSIRIADDRQSKLTKNNEWDRLPYIPLVGKNEEIVRHTHMYTQTYSIPQIEVACRVFHSDMHRTDVSRQRKKIERKMKMRCKCREYTMQKIGELQQPSNMVDIIVCASTGTCMRQTVKA